MSYPSATLPRRLLRLGVPRIGAGLGGLAWEDVEPVLAAAGHDSPVQLLAVSLPERARST